MKSGLEFFIPFELSLDGIPLCPDVLWGRLCVHVGNGARHLIEDAQDDRRIKR